MKSDCAECDTCIHEFEREDRVCEKCVNFNMWESIEEEPVEDYDDNDWNPEPFPTEE